MQFTDAVAIGGTRTTKDGYLVVDARVARTGIQNYRGSELDRPEKPVVRVYRPEDEVFSADAMRSAAFRPVTNDHPHNMVDANNWREHSVGITGDTVARDGEYIRLPFTLMDAATIGDVNGGKRELSMGYLARIDWTEGTTPQGEAYDAVQRDIRINHLAVVDAARAGPACRIGDGWSTPSDPPKPQGNTRHMPDNLRTVQVDGISIQATDQSAEAIIKLQRQVSDATAAVAAKDTAMAALRDSHAAEISTLKTQHTKDLETKDGASAAAKAAHEGVVDALKADHTKALEAKDGEIAALKAQIPDAAAMDALLVERAKIIDAARKILGEKFDPTGKSNGDIRRAAVQKRLGDAAVTDKSDDYVTAAFDTLTAVGAPPGRDPLRDALRNSGGAARQANGSTEAHDTYVKSLQDGWKQQFGGARE